MAKGRSFHDHSIYCHLHPHFHCIPLDSQDPDATILPLLKVNMFRHFRCLNHAWRIIPLSDLNKMKPTNPNAHTYVNGTDVKTHGYAVTHNTFLQ